MSGGRGGECGNGPGGGIRGAPCGKTCTFEVGRVRLGSRCAGCGVAVEGIPVTCGQASETAAVAGDDGRPAVAFCLCWR